MTKVGDVIGPRTPSPSPIPWVSVVVPAPRPPVSTTRSPARSARPRAWPHARVSSAVGNKWADGIRQSSVARRRSRYRGGLGRLGRRALAAHPGEVGENPLDARLARDGKVVRHRPLPAQGQVEELLVDYLGVLDHDDVAGVLDDDVLGTGDQPDDLGTVLGRGEQVAQPVEDEAVDAFEVAER